MTRWVIQFLTTHTAILLLLSTTQEIHFHKLMGNKKWMWRRRKCQTEGEDGVTSTGRESWSQHERGWLTRHWETKGGTQVSASTLPAGQRRSDAYETRQRRINRVVRHKRHCFCVASLRPQLLSLSMCWIAQRESGMDMLGKVQGGLPEWQVPLTTAGSGDGFFKLTFHCNVFAHDHSY